jgi:hypothetical protein
MEKINFKYINENYIPKMDRVITGKWRNSIEIVTTERTLRDHLSILLLHNILLEINPFFPLSLKSKIIYVNATPAEWYW